MSNSKTSGWIMFRTKAKRRKMHALVVVESNENFDYHGMKRFQDIFNDSFGNYETLQDICLLALPKQRFFFISTDFVNDALNKRKTKIKEMKMKRIFLQWNKRILWHFSLIHVWIFKKYVLCKRWKRTVKARNINVMVFVQRTKNPFEHFSWMDIRCLTASKITCVRRLFIVFYSKSNIRALEKSNSLRHEKRVVRSKYFAIFML